MRRPPDSASATPMTRGTIIHSIVAAVRETWGVHGLADVVSRLPEDTRSATAGPAFSSLDWYPARYVLDWDEAKMAGPAAGDLVAFRRSVSLSVDFGIGRIYKSFFRFATPTLLAERAPRFWSHNQTHGTMTVDSSMKHLGRARVTLRDHPAVSTPLSRIAFAEIVRTILSMSRARNVRESHVMHNGTLAVTLAWDE